jgi:hypothetical protein
MLHAFLMAQSGGEGERAAMLLHDIETLNLDSLRRIDIDHGLLLSAFHRVSFYQAWTCWGSPIMCIQSTSRC